MKNFRGTTPPVVFHYSMRMVFLQRNSPEETIWKHFHGFCPGWRPDVHHFRTLVPPWGTGWRMLVSEGIPRAGREGLARARRKISAQPREKGLHLWRGCAILSFVVLRHPAAAMFIAAWGISAVGSARHSHCRGQGFESPMLHVEVRTGNRFGFFLVFPLHQCNPNQLFLVGDGFG